MPYAKLSRCRGYGDSSLSILAAQSDLVGILRPQYFPQCLSREWALHSIAYRPWARESYEQHRAKGKRHNTAVRALAFKWICRKSNTCRPMKRSSSSNGAMLCRDPEDSLDERRLTDHITFASHFTCW
jgi:hypothetical protein